MLPPLAFHPVLKERAWGSARFCALGKPLSSGARIGESWEIADLPDSIPGGQSIVAGGRFDGMTLRELISAQRDGVLGVTTPGPDGAFPLLVKYLDATENLSVQVHPSAAYARAHPDARVKTEAWVVVEAEPGARLYRGFRPSVTPPDFERALAHGTVVELLETIEVARGDCIYLPSGICHALGAGIVVAEIQTPSDTTFRVWDWNRNDPARPLHLDAARACLQFGAAQEDGTRGVTRPGDATAFESNGLRSRRLLRTPFFSLELIEATRDAVFPIEPTGVAEVWMHLAGSAEWRTTSLAMPVRPGTTVLRPAAVDPGEVLLYQGHTLLRVRCGSPLDGAIA
jgi:mannose-6-phosphate isomerase